jgi:hypothetical protein
MKIDTNGNKIWAKAYDFIDSYQIITKTLAEIPDDSIYFSFCFDPSWPVPIKRNIREDLVNECRLLKFNSVGDTLSCYHYTNIGWVNDLIYDEGFLIVAGGTNYEDEEWNFHSKPTIIVVDTSGNLTFRKEFFTDTNGRINSVIKKPDGDYYVAGSTELYYEPGYYQPDRMFLMELDPDFNPVWTFVSDIQYSEGNKIIHGNDDSYSIIGDGYNLATNNHDILLWKLHADTLIDPPWVYDISNWDYAYSIKQTMDNGFIFCGSVIPQSSSFTSFFYMKINAEGIEEWHWNDNPFYHEAYDVLSGNSGYYVAGHGSDAKLVKTNLTGYGLETSLPNITSLSNSIC